MTIRRKKKKSATVKRQQARVPFPTLLATVLVLVTALGLSYMWLCSQCDMLGRQINLKEKELIVARKRLVNEQDRWSAVKAPQNIIYAIAQHKLEMSMHKNSQIVEIGTWNVSRETAMISHQTR